jgi:hypothetical protein
MIYKDIEQPCADSLGVVILESGLMRKDECVCALIVISSRTRTRMCE